ncbi:MAG: hypothetical protein LBM13_01705 [Candidatus Ancillula sp.]|jgi:16S rRNA (cytosine967-C5)-methyltransferase|nr:hypothetical protein [Candidatus Ancillula sp.]
MNIRQKAYQIYKKIEDSDSYANLIMHKELKLISVENKPFLTNLIYGTIRNQYKSNYFIEQTAKRKIKQIDKELLQILQLGVFELTETNAKKYAIIDEYVSLANKIRGKERSGFVNAILRNLQTGYPNKRLDIRYSCPKWIVNELRKSLQHYHKVDKLEELLKANDTPPNTELTDLSTLESRSTNSTELENLSWNLIVQDSGSLEIAKSVINSRKTKNGENWLDLCSAPGGKGLVLASYIKNNNLKIKLTLNELHPHRADLIKQNLSRTDLSNFATITIQDGIKFNTKEKFDRILLDAPCSGLGSIRRRQDLRNRSRQNEIPSLIRLQTELIQNAIKLLKPNGILVYSTCSPILEETTKIIDKTLNANPNLSKIQETQLWTNESNTDSMYWCILKSK